MTKIPQNIVDAVNTLLAPYGETYSPCATPNSPGYTNWKGAAKYTGLSVSTLKRAVKSGALKAPYKMDNAKNGAVVISYSSLDDYIRRH